LTVVPSAGYVFDNWSGQTQGIAGLHQNPVSFLMGDRTDDNRVITANFTPSDLRYSVTAIVEPSGGGSVRFQSAQTSDGYAVNQSISVLAVAQTGYVFSRWMGDLAGSENPRTILVSEDKSITAIFNPTVTVYCSPSEAGSVALEPAQSINGYAAGTEALISARAKKGYRFVSWEGDESSSDRSITITVDAPKTITARFVEQSQSRWWLWVILGSVGLCCALVLLRVVNARMNRGVEDEPPEPDE
jgi:uncharacterized repeat protein (TIGR02543 family)